jgi:hypothetical protein
MKLEPSMADTKLLAMAANVMTIAARAISQTENAS